MKKKIFASLWIPMFFSITGNVDITSELHKQKNNVKSAWELINKSQNITILGHHRPDGDALSSTYALSKFLEKLGKKTEIIYPSKPPVAFKIMPTNFLIEKHKQMPDLIISCDTANYPRLYYPACFHNIPFINIDHHGANTLKGNYNFVITDASSTCEVLYELMKIWNKNLIDKDIAKIILFGIITDTNVLRTKSTHLSTFNVINEIGKMGIDFFSLQQDFLINKTIDEMKLWGLALNRLKESKNKTAAWTYITKKDFETLESKNCEFSKAGSLEGLANFLNLRVPNDIIILLKEIDPPDQKGNITKVSIRTKKTHASNLAKKFGGGGHSIRAGIQSKKNILLLMEEIVTEIEDL